jgi:ubiquinone/menaquinone biosynthesis C-methylase UbiE
MRNQVRTGQQRIKLHHLLIGVAFFAVGLHVGGLLDFSPEAPINTATAKKSTAVDSSAKKISAKDALLLATAPAHRGPALGTAKPPLQTIRAVEKADAHNQIDPDELLKQTQPQQSDGESQVGLNSIRGVTCPPYDQGIDALQIPLKHLPRKKPTTVGQKYDRRAGNCATNGIWNRVTQKDHYNILRGMARLGEIKKGSFVLDWGSGCGHSLEWLTKEWGATGIGIDVSNKTIAYARANTTQENMHCVADGTKLEWLPTEFFDNVISFGSIYHVYNRTLFCHVLRQLARVVKVGGTVYNGWTENAEYKRDHVAMCLEDLPVTFKIFEEAVEFKNVEIFPLKSQQDTPNTYSLVIYKKGPIHREDEEAQFKLDNIPITCTVHVCERRTNRRLKAKGLEPASVEWQTAVQGQAAKNSAPKEKDGGSPNAGKKPSGAGTRKKEIPLTTESVEPSDLPIVTPMVTEVDNEIPLTEKLTPKPKKGKKASESNQGAAKEAKDSKVKKPKAKKMEEAGLAAAATVAVARDDASKASVVDSLQCPPYDPDIENLQIPLKHLPRKKKTSVAQKYDRRAHNCASEGIWHRVTFEDHKEILKVAAELVQISGGESVFDWGCGCGHKLAFLAETYSTKGFGVDVSNKTIEYANENATVDGKNKFCVADGTKLGWIPSNSFDVAFSFGSIYHVYNTTTFCSVLRELVRIVKPGGRVYNGWTENSEFHRKMVRPCINPEQGEAVADEDPAARPGIHQISIVEEKAAFGHVSTFPLKAEQKKPNTYSLIITKSTVVPTTTAVPPSTTAEPTAPASDTGVRSGEAEGAKEVQVQQSDAAEATPDAQKDEVESIPVTKPVRKEKVEEEKQPAKSETDSSSAAAPADPDTVQPKNAQEENQGETNADSNASGQGKRSKEEGDNNADDGKEQK